ncbi:BolA family protein [Ignatzschineria cameli]|uniref:BolA family transcriptional regulator n=1 Tax=Ignatzschineria cameli TaxID=2182793 RepID=A0A2U2AL76_9GAMM|nr:BolA family protein [Ignatzschineria cameli]PWD83959.1 BolA family transcriptional regulator [Ignatzschineria cameli]PWD85394.1 BolA family transcriptional regulator [Ignatzschineria cameli]PWD87672.1 BolA family transcriptional regulator [Ignatzschineria cameli]PWD88606.1 BolA family transcriptional regulator [Ignatzschineria cameli]PWD88924.1 BolA family transcriptional regulator [Ignatzschineria cameli]
MNNQARLDKIRDLLTVALAPTALEIIDDSHLHAGHAGARGGAGHFTVKIDSPQFVGLPLLKQHRLVYQALDSMMDHDIHALSIQITTQQPK